MTVPGSGVFSFPRMQVCAAQTAGAASACRDNFRQAVQSSKSQKVRKGSFHIPRNRQIWERDTAGGSQFIWCGGKTLCSGMFNELQNSIRCAG